MSTIGTGILDKPEGHMRTGAKHWTPKTFIIIENIKLAGQNFAHSKLRTALSALGIIIGVMSVIAITTLGGSATGSIQNSVVGAGLNSITVMAGREATEAVTRTFDLEFADRIVEEVDGVAAAVPLVSSNFTASYGKNQFEDVTVMAASADYAEIYQYSADTGMFLTDENVDRRESVAVLGAEIAESLFPDGDALGNRIRIFRNQARSFKVIGVMGNQGRLHGEQLRLIDLCACKYL